MQRRHILLSAYCFVANWPQNTWRYPLDHPNDLLFFNLLSFSCISFLYDLSRKAGLAGMQSGARGCSGAGAVPKQSPRKHSQFLGAMTGTWHLSPHLGDGGESPENIPKHPSCTWLKHLGHML